MIGEGEPAETRVNGSGLPGAKEDKGYEAATAAVATAVALRGK